VTRELGALYPSAHSIYGIDLSPVPLNSTDGSIPNVSFICGDARKIMGLDPRLPTGTADFVFSRLLLCGMTDWPGYVGDVFKMVKPGGWVERQDFEEMFYLRGEKMDGEKEWRWLRECRRCDRGEGIDLDYGRNTRGYMLDARQFVVPYRRDLERPETEAVSKLVIGDPDGYFWHAIPRMVEGLGFKDGEVREMQHAMKKCVAEEEGKYQIFWSTIGRKPLE